MKSPFMKSVLFKIFLAVGIVVLSSIGIRFLYLRRMLEQARKGGLLSFSSISLRLLMIDGFMIILLCVLIRWVYLKFLARPLLKISELLMTSQVPQADITTYLGHDLCTETRTFSKAALTTISRMQTLLAQIYEASQKILAASTLVFTTSQNQSSLLTSLTPTTNDMTAAARELVLTTQHISQDIHGVVKIADDALQFAEQGQQSVIKVIKSMEDIRRSSQISADTIIALGKQSEHINDVVKTIDRMIEDTKLIAFNATIEAARAKDEGKGFGVVALEIKRLAEEVFESTEDIKDLIQEIQGASYALVAATEQEMHTIHQGGLLAEEAGLSLKQILDMIKATTDSAQRIASATQQQQSSSEQVLQSVEKASRSTNQFARETKKLALTAAELNILAEGLRQILSHHQVPVLQESPNV